MFEKALLNLSALVDDEVSRCMAYANSAVQRKKQMDCAITLLRTDRRIPRIFKQEGLINNTLGVKCTIRICRSNFAWKCLLLL